MKADVTPPVKRGRGRPSGGGEAQARIIDVLQKLGTETDGRPRSLRSAELAKAAGIGHHSISKCTAGLLALGQISRCLVRPAQGQPTYEYRIGPGRPPVMAPLDTRKAGVARAPMISRPPMVLPKATAPARPVVQDHDLPNYPTQSGATDAAMLARIQAMNEAQFGQYVSHLARLWAWGRRG